MTALGIQALTNAKVQTLPAKRALPQNAGETLSNADLFRGSLVFGC